MPSIASADSTIVAIRKKIRRLTASASESSLSTDAIDQYINTFYSQDFPYGIKIDQMRSVYTFFTEPYRDRYPLDDNYDQGVRAPFYVDGIVGNFTKDRQQFFNVWPKFPSYFQPASGDGVTTAFTFTLTGPFLAGEVTIGTVATTGAPISVSDDGSGNLYYRNPNPVVSVPAANTDPAVPGMLNRNTGNPGLINSILIGTVDYLTGVFVIDYDLCGLVPAADENINVSIAQYQTGRPYSLLFWNNEFTIRPVPKKIHKCEIETFLTPVQFMETTDVPILNQWWQCIAIGAAIKVLEDRQDMEGVSNLAILYDRQEDLVLERQATEEIFQPNYTIFNSTNTALGGIGGIGYW